MKLINESIYNRFNRNTDDKLKNLGIGNRAIIKKWLDEMGVVEYIDRLRR